MITKTKISLYNDSKRDIYLSKKLKVMTFHNPKCCESYFKATATLLPFFWIFKMSKSVALDFVTRCFGLFSKTKKKL